MVSVRKKSRVSIPSVQPDKSATSLPGRKDSTSSRGSVDSEQPSARATRFSARLKSKNSDSNTEGEKTVSTNKKKKKSVVLTPVITESGLEEGSAPKKLAKKLPLTSESEDDTFPRPQRRTRRSKSQAVLNQVEKGVENGNRSAAESEVAVAETSPEDMLADAHRLVHFASSTPQREGEKTSRLRRTANHAKRSEHIAVSNITSTQASSSTSTDIPPVVGKSSDEDEKDAQATDGESSTIVASTSIAEVLSTRPPPNDRHRETCSNEGEEIFLGIRHINGSPDEQNETSNDGDPLDNNEHLTIPQETRLSDEHTVVDSYDQPPELAAVEEFTNVEDEHLDDEPPRIDAEEPEQMGISLEQEIHTDNQECEQPVVEESQGEFIQAEEMDIEDGRNDKVDEDVEESAVRPVGEVEPPQIQHVDPLKECPAPDPPLCPPAPEVVAPLPPPKVEAPLVNNNLHLPQHQSPTSVGEGVVPKSLPCIRDPRLAAELLRVTKQLAFEKQLLQSPAVIQPTEDVDPAERWKKMAELWQNSAEASRIQMERAEAAAAKIREERELEEKQRQKKLIEAARNKAAALLQTYAKEHEKPAVFKPTVVMQPQAFKEMVVTPFEKKTDTASHSKRARSKSRTRSKSRARSKSRVRSKSPIHRRDNYRRSRSREKRHRSRDRRRSRSRSHDSSRRHRHNSRSRSRSPRRRHHTNHGHHHHSRAHEKKDHHRQSTFHRSRHSRSPDRTVERKTRHERNPSRSYSRSLSREDSPVSPKETVPHEIPPPPAPEEGPPRMPKFEEIETLIYLDDKVTKNGKRVKRQKEPGVMCDCRMEGLDCSDNRCVNRQMLCECSSRCGENCRNRRFAKRQYADVVPFYTGAEKGWGVKAQATIPKGTFIIEYIGEVVTAEQFLARTKTYAKDPDHKHHYIFELGAKLIDATVKGNCSRFINHSCDPNAVCLKWAVPRTPRDVSRIGFFANRDILPGEEVTFDYQFLNYGKKAQQCFCGAPTCKGIIGEEIAEEGDSDDELEEEVEEPEIEDDEKNEEERIQREFEQEEEREYLAQKRITSIISSAIPRIKMAKKAQILVRDLMHVDESNFKLRVLSFLEHSETFFQVLKRSNLYDVFASWLSPVDWSRHDMELKLGVFRLISNQDGVDKTVGWTVSCCQAVENLATMEMPDVLAIRGTIDFLLDDVAGPLEVDVDADSDPDPLAELSNEELFLTLQKQARKICRSEFEDVKRSCAVTKFKIPKKVTVERAEAGKDPGSTHEYTAELRRVRSRERQRRDFFGRSNNNHFRGHRQYNNYYNERSRYFGGERNIAPVRFFNDQRYGKRKHSNLDYRDRRNDHSYDNYNHDEPRPDSRGSVDSKRHRINRFDIPARSPSREMPPQPALLDPVTGRHFDARRPSCPPIHEPVDMEIDRDSPATDGDVNTPMTITSIRPSSSTSLNQVTPPKGATAVADNVSLWNPLMQADFFGPQNPSSPSAIVAPNAHLSSEEQRIVWYSTMTDDNFKLWKAFHSRELQLMTLANERRTLAAAEEATKMADIVRNNSEHPPPPPKKKNFWRSAVDSEGATYYYHTETKETTWDLPAGETCDQTDPDVFTQEAEPDSSSNVDEARPDLGDRLVDLQLTAQPSSVTNDALKLSESSADNSVTARNENRLREFKTAVEEEIQPTVFRILRDIPSATEEKKLWLLKRVAKEMVRRETLREDFNFQVHSNCRVRIINYTEGFMKRKIAENVRELWKGYE